MNFYKVWVRSQQYRGHEPLTYSSDARLPTGAIVQVPLQKDKVLGIIEQRTSKPDFAVKSLLPIYDLPPLPKQLLMLGVWLQQFYAAPLGVITQQLLPAHLSNRLTPAPVIQEKSTATTLPPLTSEQQSVVENITSVDTYLLRGKTGSGKTRVYLELTKRALANGASALILTPEISLTSQLLQRFENSFPNQVVLLHSQLTPAGRQAAWIRLLTARTPLVIIGARSALFSPIPRLGLIVIDEAHETAYKQEQAPYYHAIRVASRLADIHKAQLIIASATPPVVEYFLAEQRHKPILSMNELAIHHQHDPDELEVVDLKDRALFSTSYYLSEPLLQTMRQALANHEQSLVYLNRRGTARVVLCENCGWQALCPHCDLPLVYHADTSRFQCHTCGFSQPLITSCPLCGHPSVTFRSYGTKAIADEVQRLFPEARIQRFDTDNKSSERFERHYDDIRSGAIDILVGTQLLAKGLDLPKLSTLGVVLADSSLYLPDFSSQERTYQLLTQVLGRVGRGHRQGHAVIQTYHPDNPVLQAALKGNWQKFYETELSERQKFRFPPFYHLLKLTCRRASYASAEQAGQKLKAQLLANMPDLTIDGPTPAFHEKLQGKYQCQLVIRSKARSQLLAVVAQLPAGWSYDIDPINLL